MITDRIIEVLVEECDAMSDTLSMKRIRNKDTDCIFDLLRDADVVYEGRSTYNGCMMCYEKVVSIGGIFIQFEDFANIENGWIEPEYDLKSIIEVEPYEEVIVKYREIK